MTNLTFAVFIANLFEKVGGYRQNGYNEAAIAFIRQGAGLGHALETQLDGALKWLEVQAKTAYTTERNDDWYRTMMLVCEQLIPQATKDLYYLKRKEEKKAADALKMGLVSHGTTGENTVVSLADAWAGDTSGDCEREPVASEEYPGTESEEVAPIPEAVAAMTAHLETLYSTLQPFALRADAVVNGWKADYGTRPTIPYLVTYNREDDTNEYFASLEEAMIELDRQAAAREESQRLQRRSQMMSFGNAFNKQEQAAG